MNITDKILSTDDFAGNGIFGLIRAFSTNFYQFATFEFLDALFGSATYAAAYIIGKTAQSNT
jgi:hypothetical protein